MNHHKFTEVSDPLVDAMRKAVTWTAARGSCDGAAFGARWFFPLFEGLLKGCILQRGFLCSGPELLKGWTYVGLVISLVAAKPGPQKLLQKRRKLVHLLKKEETPKGRLFLRVAKQHETRCLGLLSIRLLCLRYH